MMFIKDPDAVLDYVIDWTRWLAGDVINTSTWFVPSDLTISNQSNTTTTCTVWLAGGRAGRNYQITNRITTAGGRTEDRSLVIRCQER